MSGKCSLRNAKIEDFNALFRLSHDLGYAPDLPDLRKNLERILNHQDYEVVVAELNGEVVGWMTLQLRLRIEDIPFLQVAALVTDKNYRGKGIGRTLLVYAEDKARKMDFEFVGLHSSKGRVEAHQFYKNAGFEQVKESYFFKKPVI